MISERQMLLLHHAPISTWPGDKNYEDCEALVSAGLMALRYPDEIGGGTYVVTDVGWETIAQATEE